MRMPWFMLDVFILVPDATLVLCIYLTSFLTHFFFFIYYMKLAVTHSDKRQLRING